MKVREVMTTDVVTARADTPFAELVDRLLTAGVSGLPVVDEDGHVIGIVTEADLVSKEAYGFGRRRSLALVAGVLRGHDPKWIGKAAGRTAAELMTQPVAVAVPYEDVMSAARRMLQSGHKRLPVVDYGRLVGIISRQDVLRPFHRSDAEIAAEVERLIHVAFYSASRQDATVTVDGGVVTLRGSARFPSDVLFLEALAARVPGVIDVHNQVVPREPEPRW